MKKTIKIIAVALAIILLLCSCLNKEPPMEESSQTNTSLINNTVPLYNGKVITSTRQDDYLTQLFPWQNVDAVLIENFGPSQLLKKTIEEYEGKDFWYRVVVDYWHYSKYYKEYVPTSPEAEAEINAAKLEYENAKKYYYESYATSSGSERWENNKKKKQTSKKYNELKENDLKLYLSNIVENELKYAEGIGAVKIVAADANSDVTNGLNRYYMLLTAEMIEKISSRNSATLALAPAERVGDYSNKISDNLTYYISQMTDTDTIQIVAVTVADNYNKYAHDSGIQVNINYNKDLYKPFSQGIGLSYNEFNNLLDKKIVEIVTRNNIAEKRDVNTRKASLLGDYYEKTTESELESVSSGFYAVLTKAEILKLAEDEEIKVIYLAPQN